MTDLRAELQSIDGVGPKTAERITDVVNTTSDEELVRLLNDAVSYYEDGRADYAFKFVYRARARVSKTD